MKPSNLLLWLAGGVAFFFLIPNIQTRAQIVPDNTLPNNSVVTPSGNTTLIEGGTVAGNNLFHSFEQFSFSTGNAAFFNNNAAIQNIISRVTGRSVSNIDGLIQANGSANLFILNPNGIIFGPNARLNVGGSFLASTASSFNFPDGTQFSATAPEAAPLLTITAPIGLQFEGTASPIRVQGLGNTLSFDPVSPAFIRGENPTGLQVKPGNTLAIVGGDVTLEGGNLIAEAGQVELGSVAGSGQVSLTPTDKGWSLGYENVPNFGNIELLQRASVDVSVSGGGSIQVQGKRVTLTEGSAILALTQGSNSGGTLAVNASESVEVIGESADGQFISTIFTDTQGTGNGGDLSITTSRLLVQDGAVVSSETFGTGDAGKLTVNAKDSVQLIGATENGQLFSALLARTADTGAAGDLSITTNQLLIQDGAVVSAATFGTGDAGDLSITTNQLLIQDGAVVSAATFGTGDAGDLTVKAKDLVQLIGAEDGTRSNLFAGTGGSGNASSLRITTSKLLVQNGAFVSVSNFKGDLNGGNAGSLIVSASDSVELIGESVDGIPSGLFASVQEGATGAGGNLIVKTRQLAVRDGAAIAASTRGEGPGGTLNIFASESVELSGTSTNDFPSVTARTTGFNKAGDLKIVTDRLTIQDGARVTVSSDGDSGNAGNLAIQARLLNLADRGAIEATTFSGDGGNIALQVQDFLLLRNESQISTTAGTAQAGGNGGNINIAAQLIAATENSDITANAFEGNGGNINIRASGIFGLQYRDHPTPITSDINASSEFGVDGTVEINTPDIDPSQGLVSLPSVPVEPEVAQACTPGGSQAQSEFVVTGRGGLPPNPNEALSSDAVWIDLDSTTELTENRPNSKEATQITKFTTEPLVEATGWTIDDKGEVVLTAAAPTATPDSPTLKIANCHVR